MTEIFDETPVEFCMAEKRSNASDISGRRKVGDQVHLCLVHLNSILRDVVSEDDAFLDHEVALLLVE